MVALSATVSNAEEFGDWLAQVRGGTTVIVDEHRPVPLWQHMLAAGRLYDLFIETGPGNGTRSRRGSARRGARGSGRGRSRAVRSAAGPGEPRVAAPGAAG